MVRLGPGCVNGYGRSDFAAVARGLRTPPADPPHTPTWPPPTCPAPTSPAHFLRNVLLSRAFRPLWRTFRRKSPREGPARLVGQGTGGGSGGFAAARGDGGEPPRLGGGPRWDAP